MQDDPSAVSGDLCFFYQSGPTGFSAGGGVALDLSGIWGSGLLFRCDLLHYIGGNSALQPAK